MDGKYLLVMTFLVAFEAALCQEDDDENGHDLNYRTDQNFWPIVIDENECQASCGDMNAYADIRINKLGMRGQCRCISRTKNSQGKCETIFGRSGSTLDTTQEKNTFNSQVTFCTQQKCELFCSVFYQDAPGLCVAHSWRDSVTCYCVTGQTPIHVEGRHKQGGLHYERLARDYPMFWRALTAEESAAINSGIGGVVGSSLMMLFGFSNALLNPALEWAAFEGLWKDAGKASVLEDNCITVNIGITIASGSRGFMQLNYWKCPEFEHIDRKIMTSGRLAVRMFVDSPSHITLKAIKQDPTTYENIAGKAHNGATVTCNIKRAPLETPFYRYYKCTCTCATAAGVLCP